MREAVKELAALLERLRMAVDGFNLAQVAIAGHQNTVVDRVGQFADDRQAGVLQQIVHLVNRTGTGILDRQNCVVRLAGFHLGEDILKLLATAFYQPIEMAGGILACRQM